MSLLESLADSPHFISLQKLQQAEMFVWALTKNSSHGNGISLEDICAAFASVQLAAPNPTRIRSGLKSSKNIRTSKELYFPIREFSKKLDAQFSLEKIVPQELFDVNSIPVPNFVEAERVEDLKAMMQA